MNMEKNQKMEALVQEMHELLGTTNGDMKALVMVHMKHHDGRTHCLQCEYGNQRATMSMLLDYCETDPSFADTLVATAAAWVRGVRVQGGDRDD